MAKNYRVLSLKTTDFKDAHGNSWINVALEGHGEPVTMVVKDPSTVEVGKEFYGTIFKATSSKGKEYWRFKREQQEQTYHSNNSGSGKPAYDSDGQAWGNSVTNATNLVIATNTTGDLKQMVEEVLATAQMLFNGRNDRKPTNNYVHGSTVKDEEIDISPDDLDQPISLADIPF